MDRIHQRTAPFNRENGGVVRNDSDRPDRPIARVENPEARKIVGDFAPVALTSARNLRMGVVGGGMSEKSLRIARKKAARGNGKIHGEIPTVTFSPRKDARVPKADKRLRDRRYLSADMDVEVERGEEPPYIRFEPATIMERLSMAMVQESMPGEVELRSTFPPGIESKLREAIVLG